MIRALLLLAALASPAAAQQTYGVAVIGSEHFGDETLNDANPGLGLGRRFAGPFGMEANVEAGIFYNSYEEVAPYALYGLSAEAVRIGGVGLRLGAFGGIFYYDELAGILKDDIGLPSAGGFIPLVGLSMGARLPTGTDLRISALPAGDGVDAILNLSVTQDF